MWRNDSECANSASELEIGEHSDTGEWATNGHTLFNRKCNADGCAIKC